MVPSSARARPVRYDRFEHGLQCNLQSLMQAYHGESFRPDQGAWGTGKALWAGRLRDPRHCDGMHCRIRGNRSHRQKTRLHCRGLRREVGLGKATSILLIGCRNAGLGLIPDVCGAGA